MLSVTAAAASGCSFNARRENEDRSVAPSRSTRRTTSSGRQDTTTGTEGTTSTVTDSTGPRRLDIRDFGAQVDGETDDTGAVRDAIESAAPHDTVFFPEGETVVSGVDTPDSAAIPINGDSTPRGLTLAGEGRGTVIRIADAQPRYHNIIYVRVKSGIEAFTIRDLRLDGNREGQTTPPGSGGHLLTSNGANSAEVPVDVRVHNVWGENGNNSGFTPRHGGFTIDRCTVRNCADHGMSPDSFTGVHKHDPPIVIRNSLCVGNGHAGNGTSFGIDCSGGKIVVEDTVCAGNAQGTKTTEQGIEITYRRVRLINNNLFGYIRAGSQTDRRTLVTFEDVVSEGNGYAGFRFSEDTDYRVLTEIVATNNGGNNVVLANDAHVEANRVWSNRANGYGLAVQPHATGQFEHYYPYENEKGPVRSLARLVIDERDTQDKTDIGRVPTFHRVGAGTVGGATRVK